MKHSIKFYYSATRNHRAHRNILAIPVQSLLRLLHFTAIYTVSHKKYTSKLVQQIVIFWWHTIKLE